MTEIGEFYKAKKETSRLLDLGEGRWLFKKEQSIDPEIKNIFVQPRDAQVVVEGGGTNKPKLTSWVEILSPVDEHVKNVVENEITLKRLYNVLFVSSLRERMPSIKKKLVLSIPDSSLSSDMFLTLESTNVRLDLNEFWGNLKIKMTTGHVDIAKYRGKELNIDGTDAWIRISDAEFGESDNIISLTTGKVDINVANNSLSLMARSTSGNIITPSSGESDFKVTDESKKPVMGKNPNEKDSERLFAIEGEFGKANSRSMLKVLSTAADIFVGRAKTS